MSGPMTLTRPAARRALAAFGAAAADDPSQIVEHALQAARDGLGLDLVYLAEFHGATQLFRRVAGDPHAPIVEAGEVPLQGSYCQRMIDGRIGNVVPDAAAEPEVAGLALTMQARIGAYVGVPLERSDGSAYGTLCCLSHQPDHTLGEQEVRFMEVLARVVARSLERDEHGREEARRRDDHLAVVAHELRSPLASVTGYAELLADEDLSEEGRGYLEVVRRSADRMTRLAESLLLVARLEDAGLPETASLVPLGEVVGEEVEAIRPLAERRGLALRMSGEGAGAVLGERDWLAQLVDNLLGNALKFTPAGGTVTVSLARRGGDALLEVADSGPGIPELDRERLFDRFFRSESARSGGVPGAGLGLWIVRRVAQAHGGDVSVRCGPGGGTVFAVRLPLAA